jgi:osmotically-inducible protein OsmY
LKVDDGIVTLWGNVEWDFQRSAVERAVRNFSGVRGVINRVMITPRAEKQLTTVSL